MNLNIDNVVKNVRANLGYSFDWLKTHDKKSMEDIKQDSVDIPYVLKHSQVVGRPDVSAHSSFDNAFQNKNINGNADPNRGGKVVNNEKSLFEKVGNLITPKRLRFANPIAVNQADYVNWILYDRITFNTSAVVPNLVKLFIVPIGTNSKTKVDTNLEQVSRLPDPYWMNTTSLGIYFNPNAAQTDIYSFLTTEYLEYWVLNKTYLEGPLQCFPSGSGVYGSTSWGTMTANAANNSQNSSLGWPTLGNQFDLRLPAGLGLGTDPSSGNAVVADGYTGVTILQGQTFNCQFKADAGGATMLANNATPIAGVGLTLSTYLQGVLSRAVQ